MQMLDAYMHPRNLFPEQYSSGVVISGLCDLLLARFLFDPKLWLLSVVVCIARNGPINNVALKVLLSQAGVHFN